MNKSGIILIIVGCLLLAANFDLLSWSWLRQWWPLILIGLGVWSVITHRRADNERPGRTDKQS